MMKGLLSLLSMFVFFVLTPMEGYGANGGAPPEPVKAAVTGTKDTPVQLPAGASAAWWASVQEDTSVAPSTELPCRKRQGLPKPATRPPTVPTTCVRILHLRAYG